MSYSRVLFFKKKHLSQIKLQMESLSWSIFTYNEKRSGPAIFPHACFTQGYVVRFYPDTPLPYIQ